MNRIIALNDKTETRPGDECELQVTKEAQETIAVSEYIRALALQKDGSIDDALFLFSELLETQVLTDVTNERIDDKLFLVKYNCYKNIGFIHEEKNDKMLAIKNLLKAIELDDSDVYTMSRLGQIALSIKKIEIAKMAFDKCLKRNPNHWPSIDGILQVLCLSENFIDLYGWALHWYNIDRNYERAYNVLAEISERFKSSLNMMETIFGGSFEKEPEMEKCRDKSVSCFPGNPHDEIPDDFKPLDLDYNQFKLYDLNWLTLGEFTIKLYKYLVDNDNNLCSNFEFSSFLPVANGTALDISPIDEKNNDIASPATASGDATVSLPGSRRESIDVKSEGCDVNLTSEESEFLSPTDENIISQAPVSANVSQVDINVEDADIKNEELLSSEQKPKVRRRGSELSILEQWGWHKNRRSTRKKSVQTEQGETVDTTVNGFLKRIMPTFFAETLDTTIAIAGDIPPITDESKAIKSELKQNGVTLDTFEEASQNELEEFINYLKLKRFDVYVIIKMWLEKVSLFWNYAMPPKILGLYRSIFQLYVDPFDINGWNMLENDEFRGAFRIMLFDLELECQQLEKKSSSIISDEFAYRLQHLVAHSGLGHSATNEEYYTTVTRLVWLQYGVALLRNDLNLAITAISKMEEYFSNYNLDFEVKLPNVKHRNVYNSAILHSDKQMLLRKLSLSQVKTKYGQKKYAELEVILRDTIMHMSHERSYDTTTLKITIQIEVLLESLWYQEKYEECLMWSEKCLKYSLDNYIVAPSDTYRQNEWAGSVNFILVYIEQLLIEETNYILRCLPSHNVVRLVQNLTYIVSNQLDTVQDKSNTQPHLIDFNSPWIILYHILQREEDRNSANKARHSNERRIDIDENIPSTIMMFFTAHDFMGRRSSCSKENGKFLLYILDVVVPQLRSTLLESVRELIMEYIEQITYCLYGYPAKKARVKHIEEHDAPQIELTWERAMQMFDIYRPDDLPEFNSYKLESITADMEQFLLKIYRLIPKTFDVASKKGEILSYIDGNRSTLPDEINILPYRIACIYYLLADYYFKNRDFSKTIDFYVLDLTLHPTNFDSWAGLALSKSTKLEMKLNSCDFMNNNETFQQAEETFRCFEQCIKIHRKKSPIWIEYGTFAYSMHACSSRNLKHSSDTLSMEKFSQMEERKEQCINIAYKCFDTINKEFSGEDAIVQNLEEGQHDERWLYHYMLGKISEKRKDAPSVYLSHYLKSAKCLYENNATYPFKINHSNPQNLSIEALEIFYRITASVIKYIEQHSIVQRDIGRLFTRILKEIAASPFALNQAKIDDSSINALKRKLSQNCGPGQENVSIKIMKVDNQTSTVIEESKPLHDVANTMIVDEVKNDAPAEGPQAMDETPSENFEDQITANVIEKSAATSPEAVPISATQSEDNSKPSSPNRRGSQESSATTASTTTTGNSSSTSSSSSESSSDSSSSDSESDSSSDDESKNLSDDTPFTEHELDNIYKMCIKNFEECVTRFPEHYKSVYRLINYYMYAPKKWKDIEKCKKLLLGTYKTGIGNVVQGLFVEKKNNNFFNGIWRIPSPEIDRPGSFSSHLSKCVIILMEVLKQTDDYHVLLDLALQLQRKPDTDKQYLKDAERKELFQQAIAFTIQVFRNLLKKHIENNSETQILDLMVEIYKSHKKCVKYMQQKEPHFSSLIIDTYKAYIKNRIKLPENSSILDMAFKLCNYEINNRKNFDKMGGGSGGIIAGINPISIIHDIAPPLPPPLPPIPLPPVTPAQPLVRSPQNVAATAAVVASVSAPSTPLVPSTPPPSQTQPSTISTGGGVSSTATTAVTTPISSPAQVSTSSSCSRTSGVTKSRRSSSKKAEKDAALLSSQLSMYSDASMMSSLLAMYSNPNLMSMMSQLTDPTKGSLLTDYYSQLGFPGGMNASNLAGLSNLSALIPGMSMNLHPALNSSPSSTSSKLKDTINSGELTITAVKENPTSSKSSSKSDTIKASIDKLATASLGQLPAVLKKDLPSSSFASKLFQDLSETTPYSWASQSSISPYKQSKNMLPDLPKSLSITPTQISPQRQQQQHSREKTRQPKAAASSQQQRTQPYMPKVRDSKPKKSSSSYSDAKSILKNQAIKLPTQSPLPGFTLQEYNQQLALLSQYASQLNSAGRVTQLPPKKTSNKKPPQTALQLQQHLMQQNMIPIPSISPQSTSSRTPPISASSCYSKQMSPILIQNSPTKSPILPMNYGRQSQSMTPPANVNAPPTKTLQQKLAEQKQKANACSTATTAKMNEEAGKARKQDNNKKKQPINKSSDVIIIE